MSKEDNKDLSQLIIIILAMSALALFLSRWLSSSENSAAQEYVDALGDNSIERDNLNMGVVVKDLLNKIKKLEREKTVSNDKIESLQRQAAIELEQSKFLTSNVLKKTTI
tara:strand:+ start:8489 stop:8818 length:330 start_codon:yes stop_codon:yes gene_type:complete